MSYANLQINFTEENQQSALAQIAGLREMLSFLIHLNPKERAKGGKWGNKLDSFLLEAQTGAEAHPDLISPVFDHAGWVNDIESYRNLTMILAAVRQLEEGLSDTCLALRIEAQSKAGDFMNVVIRAEKRNVPGTTELLAALRQALPKRSKKEKTEL